METKRHWATQLIEGTNEMIEAMKYVWQCEEPLTVEEAKSLTYDDILRAFDVVSNFL